MRHIEINAEWASRQPFTKEKEAKSMASELFESMTMMASLGYYGDVCD